MPKGWKAISTVVLCALMLCGADAVAAEDQPWQVAKTSGEVWITTADSQTVTPGPDTKLKAGDNVRTGRNGRVLLTRGEERIVVSPNSAIGIPAEKKSDLPTTITQQAGSILLEVEKRNVRHFEVETPYLAAVVKGTQFRVKVEKGRSRVEVTRGQVQVADFKSGQNVLVLPGQSVRNALTAAGGLQLSGKGQFNAIEHGAPRQSSVRAIAVPPGGLKAPAVRSSNNAGPSHAVIGRPGHAAARAFGAAGPGRESGIVRNGQGGVRIGSMLGEVKLDVNKATNGLARGANDAYASAGRSSGQQGGGGASSLSDMSGASNGLGLGNNGNGSSSSSTGGSASGGGSGSAGGTGNGGGSGGGNVGIVGTTLNTVNGVANGLLGKLKLH